VILLASNTVEFVGDVHAPRWAEDVECPKAVARSGTESSPTAKSECSRGKEEVAHPRSKKSDNQRDPSYVVAERENQEPD